MTPLFEDSDARMADATVDMRSYTRNTWKTQDYKFDIMLNK